MTTNDVIDGPDEDERLSYKQKPRSWSVRNIDKRRINDRKNSEPKFLSRFSVSHSNDRDYSSKSIPISETIFDNKKDLRTDEKLNVIDFLHPSINQNVFVPGFLREHTEYLETYRKTIHEETQQQEEHTDVPTERIGLRKKISNSLHALIQPSVNQSSIYLFGNVKAVDIERKRQIREAKWMIHPCSKFRIYWNFIMLILLIINLITLPVFIAFLNDDYDPYWMAFNIFTDTIFLLDILVNFRSGIVKNNYADDILLDPKDIAKNYLRTWFILDLISSLPIDYVYQLYDWSTNQNPEAVNGIRAFKALRLAKLLSLLRLLRLARLIRYVNQWQESFIVAGKFLGIINMILLILLMVHWNACLQFLIPFLKDFPRESWVAKCKLEKGTWFEQYTWATFKASSHMMSIGYGRFPPGDVTEAWITMTSMLIGVTCYALFVGFVASVIDSLGTSKKNYRAMLDQVKEYMAYRKIPRNLRERIRNHFEHKYKGKMFQENEILDQLSECLKEQIVNFNCRALLDAVPFFKDADQNFVSDVILKLKSEVFQPNDYIIREGSVGKKMYFIEEGTVEILANNGNIVTTLEDGSYFGEICLLTNARRLANVRAETYCYLYSLDRDSFLEVLENFPAMRHAIEKVATERLNIFTKHSSHENVHMTSSPNISVDKQTGDCDSDIDSESDVKREERKFKRKQAITR